MEGMSERQQEVYDFIWRYTDKTGVCPSIEDVSEGLGLSSTTIATYIDNLKKKGWVTSMYGIPRSLKVIPV
jgi:repressor LexA